MIRGEAYKEDIVRRRELPSNFKEPQEVKELSMDISADGHGRLHRLNVGLLNQKGQHLAKTCVSACPSKAWAALYDRGAQAGRQNTMLQSSFISLSSNRWHFFARARHLSRSIGAILKGLL